MAAFYSVGRMVGAIALASVVASCGWFTNVPAQIRVQSIDPATVDVMFASGSPKFANPTVTAAGEYGSIGATYTAADITYFDAGGKEITNLAAHGMGINLRVEGAMLDSYPKGKFVPGTGKAALPIVNRKVLDYYASSGDPRPGTVTARVALSGMDDAHIPTTLTPFYVPVTFAGQ